MSGANAPGHGSDLSAKPEAAPVVFVVEMTFLFASRSKP